MESIIQLIPHGENISDDGFDIPAAESLLANLERAVEREGLKWQDIGLLLLTNTKVASSDAIQAAMDQSLIAALTAFCTEREWFPSLMGSSAFSAFYRSPSAQHADISDGLMVTAVTSAVFDRIPVVCEINRDLAERPIVARVVLERGVREFAAKASELGVDLDPVSVTQSSVGILLTTGSGHIAERQAVDFKECYAIGQELLAAAGELKADVVGGCATNRSECQSQCIYYSTNVGPRTHYRYTYEHAAVFTLLPYSRAFLNLNHPYRVKPDVDKLELEFHPHEAYEPGRYFYVRKINGKSPIEFLADYWPYSLPELERMVEERTAIPAEPDAHWVTIASSLSKRDTRVWPNIPVWLERIEGEVMMRMVRAEDEDANYYLMELRREALRENARDLMSSLGRAFSSDVTMLTFLCESRKYVLNKMNSNAEASEILSSAPERSAVIGIYLNGEYSTGDYQSIGYHNYSQIGAIIPKGSVRELPVAFGDAKVTAGLELFACHSSRDKPTIREFMNVVQGALHSTTRWIDEDQLLVGDVLLPTIEAAIRSPNKLVVPFLSDRSVKSAWVKAELSIAFQREREEGKIIVLPVVIDDCDEVLPALRELWPPELVSQIESRLYLRINDFTEREIAHKAQRFAEDVRRRIMG